MIETAIGVVGSVVLATASYAVGQRMSNSNDGCNGHHWGDPKPLDGKGISSVARGRAGYTGKKEHGMSKGYHTRFVAGSVYLKQDAVKRCEDCGEYESDTILVGSVPIKEFEKSVDGI
jgi:hypothetical protein